MPWWIGAAAFFGIIGIWIGVFFLKKYLFRRREKNFVRSVVELDEAAIKSAPLHERQQLTDLQDKWKESIELLSNSYLRKKGNPLYVLPWYIVLGESGVGKSSALNNARLSSPLAEVKRAEAITATRNCDWWFFDQAIVLDTAGRYTIPIDEVSDKEEWEKFLVLLAKYRRKEPLNGAVVVIPADQLLACNETKIREDGQNIRKRIDHLMRVVGAKFPIYILVTKMDFVLGFTDFADSLDDNNIQKAMGFINADLNPHWSEVLTQGMQVLSSRLRDFRLLLASNIEKIKPASLIFPNEFDKLYPGLDIFIKAVFEENPYQETPIFRGFYFSSSRQDSHPQSEFLDLVGIKPEAVRNEQSFPFSAGRGLFLKDLFAKILPSDRNLFRPTREFLRWKMITKSTGLFSWLLIWVFLCGLLSFSFFFNMTTMKGFTKVFYNPPALTRDISTDILMLDRMRNEINGIEKANSGWMFPRLNLEHSKEMEEKLKVNFISLFKEGMLRPLELKLSDKIEKVSADTPEEIVATYISFLVSEINLINTYLKTGKIPSTDNFQKITADVMAQEYPNTPVELSAKTGLFYYSYIRWTKDRPSLEARVERLQISLANITHKCGDLKWLVRKLIPDAEPVRLQDFWGEMDAGSNGDLIVSGAYTATGRKNIKEFISVLENSLKDKTEIKKKESEFWIWYRQRLYESWYDFASRFDEGQDGLQNGVKWQNMAALMTTESNPYFKFLEKMADELAQYESDQTTPPWVPLIIEINEVRKTAADMDKKDQTSVLDTIKQEKRKIAQTVEKIDPTKVKKYEQRLNEAKVWVEYKKTLAQIAPIAVSKEMSSRMLSDYFSFSEKPAENQSPIFLAHANFLKLKSLWTGKNEAPFIADLISGPLNFLVEYSVLETACYLQSSWEEQVLSPAQGVGKDKRGQMLFDKTDGLVWKFIGGQAKPFIKRGKNGYMARSAFNQEIPFNSGFFDFLNGGAQRVIHYEPDYLVGIETVPIDVNDGAKAEPFGNVLSLQCAESKVLLRNYNYPQKMNFKWSPDRCGDVTLQIMLPNLILKKEYKGRMGFAHFLKEFKDGTRTFTAADFPNEAGQLKRLGVNWISISYKIKGADQVIQLLKGGSNALPEEIVSCWSD